MAAYVVVFALACLAILNQASGDDADDGPIVKTDMGLLRGTYLPTAGGNQMAAFMSVPFAKPPIGRLRFKRPAKVAKWDGIREAKEDSPFCIQTNPYLRSTEIMGQEDCLYLNVYTPKDALTAADEPLPVMVFFHGGGWMCGAGNKFMYGPDYLLDHNVVYVGVNYRLGFFGMFSTMDEAAPGNWALKDQNIALQWIQKNIKNFGGDPKMVTIFGESAGGSSVHYHILSPKSNGLFHRAIMHSGVALNIWANAAPKLTEKRAKMLGKVMKCPIYDNYKLVDCLRNKTAEELIPADTYFYDWDFDPMIPFKPVIEPKHKHSFLDEDPRLLLSEGRFNHVPVMLGLVENEGAIRSSAIFGIPGLFDELASNFGAIAPITFDYQTSDNPTAITEAIKNYYFNGEELSSDKHVQNLTNVYSDVFFVAGIDEALQLQIPKSKQPIYFYHFTYSGKESFSNAFGQEPTKRYGACHVDDLLYIFHLGIFPKISGEDLKMSDTMNTIWTNFARSGNPSIPKVNTKRDNIPYWPPIVNADEWIHVEIGEKLQVHRQLLEERRKFWRNIPLWHKLHSIVYTKKTEHTEL